MPEEKEICLALRVLTEILSQAADGSYERAARLFDGLPKAHFLGVTEDGPRYRIVTCFICGGDSNQTCACHDGQGSACDMVCNEQHD